MVAALIAALAALVIYGYKIHIKNGHSDFDIYYRAMSDLKAGAFDKIYAFNPSGDTPFRYSPPTFFLLRPLAELPHREARFAWFLLQYLWTLTAFYFLYLSLKRFTPHASWITALSFLYVFRFCLDNFYIGQVTSIMLLGMTAGLHAWMGGSPGRAGLWLFIPASLKIGPGLFYAKMHSRKTWLAAGALLAVSVLALPLLTGSWGQSIMLWQEWIRAVAADSQYFDSSHYGAQSLKSALLRLAKSGWITRDAVDWIFVPSVITGTIAIISLWWTRKTTSLRGEGLAFSLGIFANYWFMPETFKYTHPVLAIPIAFLLAGPMGKLEWTAFGIGVATLSLAGLDILGSQLYFALQKASVPLLTSFLLFAAVLRQYLRESAPRDLRLPGFFLPKQQETPGA